MILKLSDTSYADYNRIFNLQEESEVFPIAFVGKRSYLVDATLEFFEKSNTSLIIGKYCSIAHQVTFLMNLNHTHDYLSVTNYPFSEVLGTPLEQKSRVKGSIIIGHDVWIGRGATIMPGVVIGNGAVIGANSVVTKDVEAYAVVGGNPAKVIKYRFDKRTREALNRIHWWDEDEEKLLSNSYFIKGNVEHFILSYSDQGEKNQDLHLTEADEKKYVFIPSFETNYSNLENVINQSINYFISEGHRKLVIGLHSNEEQMKSVTKQIEALIGNSLIEWVIGEEEISKAVRGCDFFITERSHETINYVSLAQQSGAKILFGADKNIFYC